METEIERLAMLQEIDQRLRGKHISLDRLEQEIRGREEQLAAKRAQDAGLRATCDEAESRRVDLEQRLTDEDTKMKDRRMRLNRVRTEKELLAIRREIELGKEANQTMEAELLACMEQIETTQQELATVEAELAELEGPATTEIAEKRAQLTALEDQATADTRRREELARTLNASLRGRYEQIFARRAGLAVVAVRNGTCQGCHMNLPPQLFNEIQKTRDVRMCPNCHRMLFWRPEAVEGASDGVPGLAANR